MPGIISPAVASVSQVSQRRVPRKPRHTFALRHKPYTIQPFLLAPVLPGETLQNALMQSRVVTDPIKNPLIGWHLEYYFFYVKLRDLDARDTFESMILNLSTDISSLNDAGASAKYYHHSGINYAKLCLKRVVEEYFRDEGEAWDVRTIDGMPSARLSGEGVFDSYRLQSEMPQDSGAVTGISGATGNLDLENFDVKYQAWQFIRQSGLTELDFEDYLKTFGVRGPKAQDPHKPELLRYLREWQYPSNTVDPTDGSVASAVSWSVSERLDKDRFFTEPGFVFGVTCARPKVYLGNQREHASHLLNNALRWLPAVMKEKVEASVVEVPQSTGPLGGVVTAQSYWLDVRDLFMHGDQFVNFDIATDGWNLMNDTPHATTSALAKYPSEPAVDELFTADTAEQVRQDGVVQLNILGTQMDHT